MYRRNLAAFTFGTFLLFGGAAYATDTDNQLPDLGTTEPKTPPPICTADMDGSGAVDFGDILEVIANWGQRVSSGSEELIGFAHLLDVINHFGESCD